MAFGRSKSLTASAAVAPSKPKSLVASAIRTNVSDLSYNLWKFRDESWQRELWRFYDIIPEFGFAADWVGSCCSRVRIYVADVDSLGRVQQETRNKEINALADTLLGGPAAKSEALRAMGINLTVAGECYILGKPGTEPNTNISTSHPPKDEWYILSSSEMRRVQSTKGEWQWAWYLPDGSNYTLDLDHNVITRVWTPHPARVWCASSPARRCHPVLRELEQLTKYVFSQIDSRLIGAGVLIIPNDLDLPPELNTTNASESLMARLGTAAAQSLRGEGTAAGVIPIIIESDKPDGWKLLNFESQLSAQALELRKEALNRLGVGLDMPPEVLTGMGDSNHWNGFLIDGYGIKVHIEPLMNRICDALTKAYLYPALKLMGKDPTRYTYAYDTAPLVLRPQRLQDALNLYDKGIIGAEAVRVAGDFKDSDAPGDEEDVEKFMRELMLRDGQLLQNAAVREAAGIPESIISDEDMIPAQPIDPTTGLPFDPNAVPPPGQEGGGGPPPPPPPTGIQTELPPPIPDTLGNVGAPPRPPAGLQASAASQQQIKKMGIVVVAEATVRRGLELAGKRLLDRETRNQFPDVPAFELHTRIRVEDQARVNRLLHGAWDQLDSMVNFVGGDFDTPRLQQSLERYCSFLLLSGAHHDPQQLMQRLQTDGVF